MASVSGDYLVCKIGTTVIVGVMKWGVQASAGRNNRQVGSHRGYAANEPGTKTYKITLQLVFDIDSGVAASIDIGTAITDLRLFRHIDDSTPAYDFGTANVFDFNEQGEINGRFMIDVEAEAFGNDVTRNDP